MLLENVRQYCLSKNGSNECLPFGNDTLVFKVNIKIFCLLSLVSPFFINLKAAPIKVIELIEEFAEIKPGYHMNKKHWITVDLNGKIPDKFIYDLIDQSYNLVYQGLTGKQKKGIEKIDN